MERPAARLLRCHLVARILHLSGVEKSSRVLSLGCGAGDTELLLAPYVAEVVGVDLSPDDIREARAAAERLEIPNARFEVGSGADGPFDLAMAIFFPRELPGNALAELPLQLQRGLAPGGMFYSLAPRRGLDTESACRGFSEAGFDARVEVYDFGSSVLARWFPGWGWGYGLARELDDWLLRFAAVRRRGSNFEIIARLP